LCQAYIHQNQPDDKIIQPMTDALFLNTRRVSGDGPMLTQMTMRFNPKDP
jgi:hypothetical protein